MKMKSLFIAFLFCPFTLIFSQVENNDETLYKVINYPGSKIQMDTCIDTLAASCGTVTDTVFDLRILENKCFKMNLPPLVGPAPNPLCAAGGAPHNMSWLAFQAGFGDYYLDVNLDACTGGQNGAQIGVLRLNDCDFGSAEEIFCIGNPCVTGIQSIGSNLFNPGEIYFLWVDGCAGSLCEINFSVGGNYFPITDNINENVSIKIGGSIWGTEDPTLLKVPSDRGGSRTQVYLKDFKNVVIDSTIADDNGNYLFDNHPGSFYYVEIPKQNFIEGGPLYGLKPCPSSNNLIFVDNDNNGFGTDFSRTKIFNYYFDHITADTSIVDTTIDFCLFDDCKTNNPLANLSLNSITDTICDITILDVLCASASYYIDPSNIDRKFCNDEIQAYNTECFAFTAGDGDYTIEVDVYGCIGGLNGAQVIVKDEWTKEDVFCSGIESLTGKINIEGNILIPGRTYYLIINGSEGSSCNYKVKINGNFIQFNNANEGVFTELPPYCVNDTITFFTNIDREVYKANCTWNIYRLSDNSVVTKKTNESKLDYKFNSSGIHLVELVSITSTCNSASPNPVNKVILIEDNPDCGSLTVELNKVQKIRCNEQGYIVTEITFGQSPYQIYIDDVLQTSLDTHYLSNVGFHELKVVDATGLERINDFWIGGTSVVNEHDLTVGLTANNFRRGLINDAWLDVVNLTCKKISGELILEKPDLVSIESIIPFPSNISNNTIRWNFTDLDNSNRIHLKFKTKQDAPLGSPLIFTATANPLLNDANPLDNVKEYTYIVTGSYDPNDKNTHPQGKCAEHFIKGDQFIDYTIRFQNTGTAAAKDVYIIDSISTDLDLNTFNVIASSHNLVVERQRDNVLKFNFPNIELPPSVQDNVASNGYVVFRAKPRLDLPLNTVIRNKSAIYFDFNDPIITNEVFHTIVDEIPVITSVENISNCITNYVEINGEQFSKDTVFTINYQALNQCDSIVTYQVDIVDINHIDLFHEICFGDVITIDGQVIDSDSLIVTEIGCDTILYNYVDELDEINVPLTTDGFKLYTSGGFISYQWIDCNDEASFFVTNDSFFIPFYNGDFRVKAFSNLCAAQSECISFIVNTSDLNWDASMIVIPNPANDEITINGNLTENANCTIVLYNSEGSLIKSLQANTSNMKLDLSDVHSGSYFIRIRTEQGIYQSRFIKM